MTDLFSSLSREQQHMHHAESERQVRALIEVLGDSLADGTRTWSIELADHNEMGLAFEAIFDFLVEHRIAVSIDVRQAMESLAKRMSMTELDWSALAVPNSP